MSTLLTADITISCGPHPTVLMHRYPVRPARPWHSLSIGIGLIVRLSFPLAFCLGLARNTDIHVVENEGSEA
jgi:hypothetical protein